MKNILNLLKKAGKSDLAQGVIRSVRENPGKAAAIGGAAIGIPLAGSKGADALAEYERAQILKEFARSAGLGLGGAAGTALGGYLGNKYGGGDGGRR